MTAPASRAGDGEAQAASIATHDANAARALFVSRMACVSLN
ncbi:MAG: hypothetical protein NVV62_04660 [Terricaulis sp.]|nr:hypothetical protein [Terricaulis sp.]